MNIRCAFCQMPYTLSRMDMLDALQEMDAHKLAHYDAHCPRCRRATQIPRQRMEMFMPNWRQELQQFEAEMKEHPQHEAPLPAHEPVAVAPTDSTPVAAPAAVQEKSAPKTVKEQKPAAKSKPAKPAAKTSSPKGKAPAAKARKRAATTSKGKKTTKKSK